MQRLCLSFSHMNHNMSQFNVSNTFKCQTSISLIRIYTRYTWPKNEHNAPCTNLQGGVKEYKLMLSIQYLIMHASYSKSAGDQSINSNMCAVC